ADQGRLRVCGAGASRADRRGRRVFSKTERRVVMRQRLGGVLVLAALALTRAAAQAPAGGSVIRMDPAFDAVVSPGVMVETLKEGFGAINGIVWVREGKTGHLLISDIPANVVHKWTPDGAMTAFLVRPDWTRVTEARPANVRFGANGIAIDPQGRIVY